MANAERVTVTLPSDLLSDIDRIEKNRSRFVLEAVRHELQRRRREQLHHSLKNPHPDSADLAEQGFGDWAGALPDEDVGDLVDPKAGKPLHWVPGKGWVGA